MLEAMVSSINASMVEEKDVLTDKVYHYDAKERIFKLGEKFEARKAEKEVSKDERSSVLQQLKEKQKEVFSASKINGSKDKAEMAL